MPSFDLVMPKMGESITEATILKWLKKPGDTIRPDEPVLEIATDKVDSEVPSPVGGVLKEVLFKEGDVVPVGKAVAIIETNISEPVAVAAEPITETVAQSFKQEISVPAEQQQTSQNGERFYSPLVLNIARQEKISMAELETISGSGAGGRVTKKDILAYVDKKRNAPSSVIQAKVVQTESENVVTVKETPQAKSYTGNIEIIEMDRMRKLIAENMVRSKQTSAHVTSFVEADVTNIVLWRNKVKETFQQRYGENLTYTPIFIEAVVKALKDFPMVNSSVDGKNIIIRKDINIGMATALPTGNLIVPVIKNADQLNLAGLAKQVNDLANRARNNKLRPEDIEGATYTVSNVGTFGNLMGTPIIMQPQVAILATGAIKKKPVVIETESGDTIGIRHMMFLSHSYDHRIIDGALGGSFVRRVADYLEGFDVNRSI
ncbi:MAG: dihydrolipoamide acetyltransferase family protein [Chitinophagales bacterium]|nr:2-oxo acid dehydrogenase subunit E2 [Chitinophagales bacterium]MDW8274034.1 dihydrolipoamide acetyltransferase family protein [Chitinophagales bacterium]